METIRITLIIIAGFAAAMCIKGFKDIIVRFLEIKKEGREYHNLFD